MSQNPTTDIEICLKQKWMLALCIPSPSISITSTGIFLFCYLTNSPHFVQTWSSDKGEILSLDLLIQNDSLCLCAKFLLLWWKLVSTDAFKILFKEAGFLEGSLSGRSGTLFLNLLNYYWHLCSQCTCLCFITGFRN